MKIRKKSVLICLSFIMGFILLCFIGCNNSEVKHPLNTPTPTFRSTLTLTPTPTFRSTLILTPTPTETLEQRINRLINNGNQSSAQELVSIGKSAVPQLIEALSKKTCDLYWVIWVLDKLCDSRAIQPLIDFLQNYPLDWDTWFLHREAISTLKKFDNPLIPNALKEYGVNRIIPMLEWMADDSIKTLVLIGEPVVIPLINTIQHNVDNNIRRWSCRALGEIGDSRAVDPLIAALDDEWDVRIEAAYGLGILRAVKAIEPLAKLFDGDDRIFGAVFFALGNIGVASINTLCCALDHSNPVIRRYAASTLGQIPQGKIQAISKISQNLETGDSAVIVPWIFTTNKEVLSSLLKGMASNPLCARDFKGILLGFDYTDKSTFLGLVKQLNETEKNILLLIDVTNEYNINGGTTDDDLLNIAKSQVVQNNANTLFGSPQVKQLLLYLEDIDPQILKDFIIPIGYIYNGPRNTPNGAITWAAQSLEHITEDIRLSTLAQNSTAIKLLVQEGTIVIPSSTQADFVFTGWPPIIIELPIRWTDNDINRLNILKNSAYQYYRLAAQSALNQIAGGDYFVHNH